MTRPLRPLLAAASAALFGVVVLAPAVATGSIEEQRARLPPPAECTDLVEGTWMSLRYTHGEWYEFTLQVRRAAEGSDDLVGEIVSHFWYGGDKDERPPACVPGGLELFVKMTARGKADAAGKVRFGGTSWKVDRVACGGPTGYNLDQFAGTIDPKLQEFVTIINDGGRFVNEPAVFRRIKCIDPPRKDPAKEVRPPAFSPEKRASGCGR